MADQSDKTQRDSDGAPASLDEAVFLFSAVMSARNVPFKSRKHFVRCVTRFNEFRVERLKRSFQTIGNSDVAEFLRDQQSRFAPPDWQLRQAQESVVLFLRNVIELEAIDTRQVSMLFRGEDDISSSTDVPTFVDETRPEWYQQVQRSLRTASRDCSRDCKASNLPFTTAQLRNAFNRIRCRHPHRSGTPRTQGCLNDDDLHPRAESSRRKRTQPTRSATKSSLTRVYVADDGVIG